MKSVISSNRIKFEKYWVKNHIRFFVFLTLDFSLWLVQTLNWYWATINLNKCFFLFSDREQRSTPGKWILLWHNVIDSFVTRVSLTLVSPL